MTSWLTTNSRKRTHSDSDNKKDHPIQKKPEESSELTWKEHPLENKEQTCALQSNQIQELGTTKDSRENYLNGQKSPAMSPLRKRMCIHDPLHSSSSNNQNHRSAKPQLNPGKENRPQDSSEDVKEVEINANCKQTLTEAPGECVKVKSKCQASAQAKPKNWLLEWSAHWKAKYGDKSGKLPEKGSESNMTETVNASNDLAEEDETAVDLQPISAQVSRLLFVKNLADKNALSLSISLM